MARLVNRRREWRLVLGAGDALTPLTGSTNMAIDAALLDSVRAGAPPTLRFYLWRPACLSLGRNQRARGVYDPALAAAAGVDIVRRPTGGLAVLHDAEVTYAVIAPVGAIGRPRAAYAFINDRLADALRDLGVMDVRAAGAGDGSSRPSDPSPPPCFDRPAAGEIVARGAKLIGSAQRVERGVLLQHGSILLDGSQQRVRMFERAVPVAAGVTRAASAAQSTAAHATAGAHPDGGTSLRALLGAAPTADRVVAAAAAAFTATGGIALAPGTLDSRERERVRTFEQVFGSADWTWRC